MTQSNMLLPEVFLSFKRISIVPVNQYVSVTPMKESLTSRYSHFLRPQGDCLQRCGKRHMCARVLDLALSAHLS